MKSKKDQPISVALTPRANATLNRLKECPGLAKRATVESVLNWFCEQNEMLQMIILGCITEEENVRSVIQILYDQHCAGLTPGEALQAAAQKTQRAREGKKATPRSAS